MNRDALLFWEEIDLQIWRHIGERLASGYMYDVSRIIRKEVVLMLRLHSFLYSHRSVVKLVVIVAAVAAMTLGATSSALADDGLDP